MEQSLILRLHESCRTKRASPPIVDDGSSIVKAWRREAYGMARVIQGNERRSQTANKNKETSSSPTSKRRGNRQRNPSHESRQGRGVAKQNNQKKGARAQAKG